MFIVTLQTIGLLILLTGAVATFVKATEAS